MSFHGQPDGLEYYPCRYGGSRTVFRGPQVSLDGPYTVVVGGSEVYGRYVEDPFTDQLAEMTGRRVVNMGVMNAGVDVFARDEALMHVLENAETVVVQVIGAQNMSNRYYTVHPRRNDRFLEASRLMTDLYRDVDFSEFSFTRHMLVTLRRKCTVRFAQIETELEAAWTARMQRVLGRIQGRCILLHLEDGRTRGLGPEPAFVASEIVDRLRDACDDIVRRDISGNNTEEDLARMVFPQSERTTAVQMLSTKHHERIAIDLARIIGKADGIAAA